MIQKVKYTVNGSLYMNAIDVPGCNSDKARTFNKITLDSDNSWRHFILLILLSRLDEQSINGQMIIRGVVHADHGLLQAFSTSAPFPRGFTCIWSGCRTRRPWGERGGGWAGLEERVPLLFPWITECDTYKVSIHSGGLESPSWSLWIDGMESEN